MKIAYCTSLLPEEKKLMQKTKNRIPGVAGHKFSSALIQGIDENLSDDDQLKIFAFINTLNFPKFPQVVFKNEQWSHNKQCKDLYLGYVNLFGIKYITQSYNLYKNLEKWICSLNETGIICVYNIFYPIMKAAIEIKKKYPDKVKLCLITGDMVVKYNLKSQNTNSIKQRMIDKMELKIFNMVKEFDMFVFATKDMATAYNVENKPYVIVECTYISEKNIKKDIYSQIKQRNEKNKKIIFYAGAVRSEYGIDHLLQAFELIQKPNYELWIAGGGNYEDVVKQYAEKNNHIRFFGFVSPEKVKDLTSQSTLMVNPRVSKGNEYVKYSFPSKTMEGLASGKPFVAHKLPCYPEEYNQYILYPDDESNEALAKKIVEVCELDDVERARIAEKARKFITQKKNPKRMCAYIYNLMRENSL